MKEVYENSDLTMVSFCKSILENEGIACFIRNENTRSFGMDVLGYSQPPTHDPVLCIANDDEWERAVELLGQYAQRGEVAAEPDAGWLCPQCKESVPATFDSCWNCQTSKPES